MRQLKGNCASDTTWRVWQFDIEAFCEYKLPDFKIIESGDYK
jgi:hypothetical protein